MVKVKAGWGTLGLMALLHCGGGSSTTGPGPQPPPGGLAVYVYTDLATDLNARGAFFAFAKPRNIRSVYLQSAGLLGNAAPALGDLVADAHHRGMAVTLLFGRAEWALTANQATALAYAAQSLSLVTALKAAGQPAPDALQFDVEPYVLPQWTTDLQGTANQYLDLLDALRTQLQGQLPLLVAVPRWLDGDLVTRNGQTRPLSEWVLDAVDGIVMMDYQDGAPSILAGASSELAYASAHGKTVTLALDVQCGSDPSITFCEEGQAFMYQQMATVDASARSQSAYQGLGVFNYEDWQLLRP